MQLNTAFWIILPLISFSANLVAVEPPSNEELYKMFLELKQDQERLKQEAEQARAEAEKAKRELEITHTMLEKTQEALKSTEEKITQTEKTVAQTREGLEQTKAEMGTAPSTSVVRIPQTEQGGFVNLSLLYKRPENDRYTYAVINSDNPGGTEQLTAVDIDTEYEPGFQIGAGYMFPHGAEGFINFSYFSFDARDEVTDPPGGADLHCTLCPIDGTDIDRDDDIDSATGDYKISYRVLDAGVAQQLGVGNSLGFRLGGGVRYASIDESFGAIYIDGGDRDTARMKNNFWGFGPRGSLDVTWNVMDTGFSLFGNFGASLLAGRNDFLYDARDNDGDVVSIDSDNEGHVITVFDAAFGVAYANNINNVQYNLKAGYEFETWLDLFSRADFIDNQNDPAFTREDTNLDLHGLFLRGEIKW